MSTPPTRFTLVDDAPHACPYLPGRSARTPLRLPSGPLDGETFDGLLAAGERRAGVLLYRTECPSCTACEALRVPVARFTPTKSQRRVLRRDADVRVEVVRPQASADRVALYNRHRTARGLGLNEEDISEKSYRMHYVQSCVPTVEIDYLVGDRLVAASILDVGAKAASSVYHCFEPDEGARSLGVYSVLREIALCAEWGLDWYYLGLWVEACASLSYKSAYFPHQRRQDGVWREYAEAGAPPVLPPEPQR